MKYLWPLIPTFCGIGVLTVGLSMYSTNNHMGVVLVMLGVCIAVGSFTYGFLSAVREDMRDQAKMAKCQVWCERNSPPEQCTCGRCR